MNYEYFIRRLNNRSELDELLSSIGVLNNRSELDELLSSIGVTVLKCGSRTLIIMQLRMLRFY